MSTELLTIIVSIITLIPFIWFYWQMIKNFRELNSTVKEIEKKISLSKKK